MVHGEGEGVEEGGVVGLLGSADQFHVEAGVDATVTAVDLSGDSARHHHIPQVQVVLQVPPLINASPSRRRHLRLRSMQVVLQKVLHQLHMLLRSSHIRPHAVK